MCENCGQVLEDTPLVRLYGEAPLDLTRTVRDISVTERGGFRTCRRRWYLETIENLEKRGVKNWALDFGTGIHMGLDSFYRAYADIIEGEPLERALEAFEVWYQKVDKDLRFLGDLSAPLRDELLEYNALGQGMLRHYNEYSVEEDGDFEWVLVEGVPGPRWSDLAPEKVQPPYAIGARPFRHESGRILCPIVHPGTKAVLSSQKGGHPPYLSARLDLIGFRRTMGLRGFWILDHKTSASQPSDRGIDFEDQITGYCYVFWRLTGIIPRGTIFNFLVKHLPKEPRLVYNDTKLSTAKDQLTLPDMYESYMREFQVMDSPAHLECLASLKAHGRERFFKRFEVERNQHELEQFEKRLFEEYHDMFDAYKFPERRAYPNPSYMHCPNCSVNSICQAIEDGSDYDWIIETRYQQAKDRKAKDVTEGPDGTDGRGSGDSPDRGAHGGVSATSGGVALSGGGVGSAAEAHRASGG